MKFVSLAAVVLALLGLGLALGWPFSAATATVPLFAQMPTTLATNAASALPAVPYNSRFGLCWVSGAEMSSVPASRYQRARDTGARWNRWVMYWVDHERTQGSINWSSWDANTIRDRQNGFHVLALLQQTPDWAVRAVAADAEKQAVHQKPGPKLGPQLFGEEVSALDVAPPRNLDRPVFLPNGAINPDNYWGYFVWRVVNRYKPGGDLARQQGWTDGWGIRHWEIWNEPNLPEYWGGSVAEYYLLLKVAYQAAKAADPNAVILWGGIAHHGNTIDWARALMDEMVRDTNRTAQWPYFDVSNWHWYSQPSVLYDQSRQMQAELERRGMGGRPMWITETNVPAWGDYGAPTHPSCEQYPYSASVDEQASYAIQAYANAIAAGVERIFVHQFQDDQWGIPYAEAWGLMRNDGTLRPLYAAYQVAAKYFYEPLHVSRQVEGSVVKVVMSGVRVNRPTDLRQYRVTVLWNSSGSHTTASVSAVSSSAQLVTKGGSQTTIVPSGGKYRVSLPAATAKLRCEDPNSPFMIGGDPRLLIEESNLVDVDPPTAWVNPLPVQSPPSFTVTWTGSDGPEGSGVKDFDVQFRNATTGSDWQTWLAFTTATSATFNGHIGHTYQFRCRARDFVGNEGNYPAQPQAQTTVADTEPPTASINPLPSVVDPTFSVSWTGSDGPTGSGVRDYDVQYRNVTVGGTWQTWLTRTPATSATFSGFMSHTYQFRCRARDNAGNQGAYPSEAQAQTTIRYIPPPTGLISNGGFENTGSDMGVLVGWTTTGAVRPILSTLPRSGSYSALLGRYPGQSGGTSGDSTLYQRFIVPTNATNPKLSFYYRIENSQAWLDSWFEARLQYVDPLGQTRNIWLTQQESQSRDWRRVEFDLAAVGSEGVDMRGKVVDLYFKVVLGSTASDFRAYVDDVEAWPHVQWFPISSLAGRP